MLGATAVAAITILILASSNFNVPARQFSALIPLICVLAAAGATAPARVLAGLHGSSRLGASSPLATVSVGLAGAALILAFALPSDVRTLRSNLDQIATSHDAGRALSRAVARALPLIDTHGAKRHSVAMIGAVDHSQLVWVLGVPFNAVTNSVEPSTRLIVRPAPVTSSLLHRAGMLGAVPLVPRGWRLIVGGAWDLYALAGRTPVRLG